MTRHSNWDPAADPLAGLADRLARSGGGLAFAPSDFGSPELAAVAREAGPAAFGPGDGLGGTPPAKPPNLIVGPKPPGRFQQIMEGVLYALGGMGENAANFVQAQRTQKAEMAEAQRVRAAEQQTRDDADRRLEQMADAMGLNPQERAVFKLNPQAWADRMAAAYAARTLGEAAGMETNGTEADALVEAPGQVDQAGVGGAPDFARPPPAQFARPPVVMQPTSSPFGPPRHRA